MKAVGLPALYEVLPTKQVVPMAKTFDLTGRVVDENGSAVGGSDIYVGWPALVGRSDGTMSRLIAKTNAEGEFVARLDFAIAGASQIIAYHQDYALASEALLRNSTLRHHVELVLPSGVLLQGIVRDVTGNPLAGVRINAVEDQRRLCVGSTSTYLPPKDAAAEGIKSSWLRTDEHGRFAAPGWPTGINARIFVANPPNTSLVSIMCTTAKKLWQREFLAPVVSGMFLEFMVEVRAQPRLILRGQVIGFSAAERSNVKLKIDYGDGGGYRPRMEWKAEGRFEAGMTLPTRLADRGKEFTVVMEIPNHKEISFGPYTATERDLVVENVIITK